MMTGRTPRIGRPTQPAISDAQCDTEMPLLIHFLTYSLTHLLTYLLIVSALLSAESAVRAFLCSSVSRHLQGGMPCYVSLCRLQQYHSV